MRNMAFAVGGGLASGNGRADRLLPFHGAGAAGDHGGGEMDDGGIFRKNGGGTVGNSVLYGMPLAYLCLL